MGGVESVNTVAAAFVAGLVTSVHCVGMCGPLACSLTAGCKAGATASLPAFAYHGGRLLSYGLIGALAGVVGQAPLRWLTDSPAVVLPWFLVFVFLLVGLGLHQKFPRPKFLGRWILRFKEKFSRMSAGVGALMVGLLTPLLPCGPLYIMFGLALVSGSAARGAEFTLAFGLGTVPLLWILQHQMTHLRARLKPATMVRIQRGLAVLTAVVLAWRLRGTLWFVDGPAGCCH